MAQSRYFPPIEIIGVDVCGDVDRLIERLIDRNSHSVTVVETPF